MKREINIRFLCRAWLLVAIVLLAVCQSVKATVVETLPIDVDSRLDSKIYVVNKSVTIKSNRIGISALWVNHGSTATIYIPKGVTLEVQGCDASERSRATPGINVPSNSTLIITGEGTLIARGGNGGNGGDGLPGDAGWLSISARGGRGEGAGGRGGLGGHGGGGAAPGIGGLGGDGADLNYGPYGVTRPCESEGSKVYDHYSVSGNPSKDGDNGETTGKVYITGSVRVQAYGGKQGERGGAGSNVWGGTANDAGSGFNCDYASGGGGPGGGGGSGYAAEYGIGGGAPGGQSGASGASGGTWWSHSHKYIFGKPGQGGNGGVQGGDGYGNPPSDHKYGTDSHGGERVQNGAVSGGHGSLYSTEAQTIGGRKAEDIDYISLPSEIKVSVKFDANGGEPVQSPITAYYGVYMNAVTVPEKKGMKFQGYYTSPKDGKMIFNGRGDCLSVSTFAENTTLYAHWTSTYAINVTTGKVYDNSAQAAFDEASDGDRIRLCADIDESVTIKKSGIVDFDGHLVSSVDVRDLKSGKSLTLTNGRICNVLTSYDKTGELVLDKMTVDGPFLNNGQLVTINSGVFENLVNVESSGHTIKNSNSIVVKGDNVFVKKLNKANSDIFYQIYLTGGYYACNPLEAPSVVCPANYKVVTLDKAPDDAPDGTYIYKVEHVNDIQNHVVLTNQHLSTNVKATKDTKLKMQFMLKSMPKKMMGIVGRTDNADLDAALKGFGLFVDGTDGSFVFAAGTDFCRSPKNIAMVDQMYYLTLSSGTLRVDTIANPTADYYHHDIPMYVFRDDDRTLCIGAVNGQNSAINDNYVMSVYDVDIHEGDKQVLHYVPAYGFNNATAEELDYCMYDVLNNEVRYDTNGKVFKDGAVGLCEQHPAYRVIGNGKGGNRMCVICGQLAEAEPFIDTPNSTAQTPAWTLSANGVANPVWKKHHASNSGNMTEITETKSTTDTQLKIYNEKVFSYELYSGDKLVNRYIPATSCGKLYLHDTMTDKYYLCNDKNATANFDIVDDHLLIDSIHKSTGEILHLCKACGLMKVNNINLGHQLAFDTGTPAYSRTIMKIHFKADPQLATQNDGCLIGRDEPGGDTFVVGSGVLTDNKTYFLSVNVGAASEEDSENLTIGQDYYVTIRNESSGTCHVDGNVMDWHISRTYRSGKSLYLGASKPGESAYFTIYDVQILDGDNLVCHLLPSRYGGKPCFYDAVRGVIIDTMPVDQQQDPHTLTDLMEIYECVEHKYLSGEVTMIDGQPYRTCMICEAKVEDHRQTLPIIGDQYIDTKYIANEKTRVRTTFKTTAEKGTIYGGKHFGMVKDTGYAYSFKDNQCYTMEQDINQVRSYAGPESTTPSETFSVKSYADTDVPLYIGANFEVKMASGISLLYEFDIYEGDKHLKHLVPAINDGTLGVLETFSQEFYPLQNSQPQTSESQSIIVPCRQHVFYQISKTKDQYGNEHWKRTCRICGHQESVIGERSYIYNNGAAYYGDNLPSDPKLRQEIDLVNNIDPANPTAKQDCSLYPNVTIYEVCLYDDEGTMAHRYLPSIFEGKQRFYDAVTDKFYSSASLSAEEGAERACFYVPTCTFHRYYALEKEGEGDEAQIYRHCKLCDARMPLSGLQIDSEEMLRKYIYDDNTTEPHDLYIDMMGATGSPETVLSSQYPKLTDKNIVFGIAVMYEGKLMDYFLPARRHSDSSSSLSAGESGEKGPLTYGMYNTVKNAFTSLPSEGVGEGSEGAKVYIVDCKHPYTRPEYNDNGNTYAHCHLCDETPDSIVGYHIHLTYYANRDADDKELFFQNIYMMTDGSDDSSKTLVDSPFTNGAHFFGGWTAAKDGSGKVLKPLDEYMPSADFKGNKALYAKWEDGIVFNGDTLCLADAKDNISIVDDAMHPFHATANFHSKSISLSRQLPADGRTWGTLCLPFPIQTNTDMQLYKVLRSGTNATGQTSVVIEEVESVEAGQPCIFKLATPQDVLILKAEDVDVVGNPGILVGDDLQLTGSYDYRTFDATQDGVTQTYFGISGDKFVKTSKQVTIRPYRAYIETAKGTSLSSKGTLYLILESEATGMNTFSAEEGRGEADASYYDLTGRKVDPATATGIIIRKVGNATIKEIKR